MTEQDGLLLAAESADRVTSLQDLARVLRDLRRRQAHRRGDAELTYRMLAARTSWSIGIIAQYFNGRSLPPTDRFDVLVNLLGATPTELRALATARDRVAESRRHPAPAPRPDTTGWPVPRQLPADGVRFTGRTAQLDALDALIGPHKTKTAGTLAVVSGTAGVGKSALAVHWAHRVADRFPDGQLYVNLRGFDPQSPPMSPAEAVRGFLDAFGVTAQRVPVSAAAQIGLYRSLLADRRVLLLLDNAADADQVRALLPGSPGCVTLVTSRNQLSSLIAVEGAGSLTLDMLSVDEARDLLARRLGGQRIAAEPAIVEEVITRCARLPLALVIVAARASVHPTFPLAAIAGELRNAQGCLDPFTGEDATADARAAFSCSYRHLRPAAARLFRLLGAHPGPDVAAPALASLADLPLGQVRPLLGELTRAHLVREHSPGRYAFHDLLRAYAVEMAQIHDAEADRRTALRRALEHYLHTAQAAALLIRPLRTPLALPAPCSGVTPEPLAGREQAREWFAREHRVLIAAVSQAARAGSARHSWQLAWAMGDFLDWQGHWHDLVAVQRVALAAAERTQDLGGQAHAHRQLARGYIRLSRYADGRAQLKLAIELSRAVGDRLTEADSRLNLSLALEHDGEHRLALAESQRALELFRTAGFRPGQATSLNVVGWCHSLLGDHEQAVVCCRQALALHEEVGDLLGLAPASDSLGYAYHNLGRYRDAAAAYQHAIDTYREIGDRYNEADTLVHLGDTHQAAGEAELARATWRAALDALDDLDHPAAQQVRTRLAG